MSNITDSAHLDHLTDFNTYVINLKKDYNNFLRIKRDMAKTGIDVIRYDAVYGKEITDFDQYDKYLSTYCKYFCPKGALGCGLSHYTLLDKIHRGLLPGTNNKYTLILEDDVYPLFNNKTTIIDIINSAPADADAILLHCNGYCLYDKTDNMRYRRPESLVLGSNAAYLVKNTAIPKLLNHKLYFHVDMQWWTTIHDTVYIYHKPLFYTDDSISSINNSDYINNKDPLLYLLDNYYPSSDIHNTNISRTLTYPIFRIPIINIEVKTIDFIYAIVITLVMLLIYCMYVKKSSKN